ncbi:hypothetical protein SAMN05421736_12937 [Evansella caseinilytica]|uniref:Uncharacterized protein n=1 Tax=Evansella caseinilytica TaxID=1503961 RepID=A0A1H3UY10_9BACI|nr:hypothetical protein SAMN05421736_12937 [Evansella caseinilytica]
MIILIINSEMRRREIVTGDAAFRESVVGGNRQGALVNPSRSKAAEKITIVQKEDITAARRSRRGRLEQRSVHETYVSSEGATQQRASQALLPGLFEQPL